MKKITKSTLSFIFLSLALVGCQSTKKEQKAQEPTAVEQSTGAENNSEGAVTFANTVLNANLATEQELKESGIAPELAFQIVEKRPFLTMLAFDSLVDPDVDKTVLYQKIFVPMNLNTTAEADFKMIPGVGDRMAHEFEEYRPYTSIKQFRREIGKYVDDAEVARYEHYVFVPVALNTATEDDIKALPGVGSRMAHEFEEYRPYTNMNQFRKEIGKYVDDKELERLVRLVYLKE